MRVCDRVYMRVLRVVAVIQATSRHPSQSSTGGTGADQGTNDTHSLAQREKNVEGLRCV